MKYFGSDLRLRFYQKGDEFQINKLFNLVFKQERPINHWHWKFQDAPYGALISVAEDSRYGIVAHIAGIKLKMWCDNQSIWGLCGVDAMRHPAYGNNAGCNSPYIRCAKFFKKEAEQYGLGLLFGFPSEHHRKRGEKCLGFYAPNWVWELVLNTDEFNVANKPCLAKLWFKYLVKSSFQTKIDKSIDRFWERIRSQYSFIVERDFDFYNWRINKNPQVKYGVITFRCLINNQILGFLIYRVFEKQCFVIDLVIDRRFPLLLYFLMENLIKICQKMDLKIIKIWLSNRSLEFKLLINSLGFKFKKLGFHYITWPFKNLQINKGIFGDFFYSLIDYDVY